MGDKLGTGRPLLLVGYFLPHEAFRLVGSFLFVFGIDELIRLVKSIPQYGF